MPAPQADAFRQSVESGLYLPPAESRTRIVLTRTLWKLLDRLTLELHKLGIQVSLECTHVACKGAKFEAARLHDGSYRLRCPHADYVMVKHV